jgi:predicted small lipoprotein YifL
MRAAILIIALASLAACGKTDPLAPDARPFTLNPAERQRQDEVARLRAARRDMEAPKRAARAKAYAAWDAGADAAP